MTPRVDAVDALDSKLGWVRRCHKCRVPKPHKDFGVAKRDHKGIQRACKECAKGYDQKRGPRKPRSVEQHKERYANEREHVIAYSRAHYRTLRGRLLTLISSARFRARAKGWPHDLDIDWALALWVQQEGRCLITGVPLELDTPLRPTSSKELNPFAPSLDRIDCNGGYTKDNTRLVCVAANLAMNRFGADVFRVMLSSYAKLNQKALDVGLKMSYG